MSDVGFPGPIADTPEPETSIRFAIDQLEALDRQEAFTEVPTCLLEGITHLLKNFLASAQQAGAIRMQKTASK